MKSTSLVAGVVSAGLVAVLAGSAVAQSSYGSIQFRWRERGIGVLDGPVSIPVVASGFSGTALNQVTNPTLTTDARFFFVLEARVSRAAGNTDLGGLSSISLNTASTDQRSLAQFAGTQVGATNEFRNAAPASLTAYSGPTLPSGATTLPGTDNVGDRGIFGPFRGLADLGGKNQAAIGVQNRSAAITEASMEGVALSASLDPLASGPYANRFDFYGLDTWVPIYTFVYNLADVGLVRQIVITTSIFGAAGADSGIRGFRFDSSGNPILNSQGQNSWPIDNGGGLLPISFGIPTPAAASLLLISGMLAHRRRRA